MPVSILFPVFQYISYNYSRYRCDETSVDSRSMSLDTIILFGKHSLARTPAFSSRFQSHWKGGFFTHYPIKASQNGDFNRGCEFFRMKINWSKKTKSPRPR